MKTRVILSVGLGLAIWGQVAGVARAQNQRVSQGTIVPGVAWYGAPRAAIYQAPPGAFVSIRLAPGQELPFIPQGLVVRSTGGSAGPEEPLELPSSSYGGRVAAWVPSGGSTIREWIRAPHLLKPATPSTNGGPVNALATAEGEAPVPIGGRVIGGSTPLMSMPGGGGLAPYPATPAPTAGQPAASPVSSTYYANYGLGTNYYTPTYNSYGPFGGTGGYPVPFVTYPGGVIVGQSGASSATLFTPGSQGYISYSNGAPYFGRNTTSVTMPGYITYGQNSQAATVPAGYYVPYVPNASLGNAYGGVPQPAPGTYLAPMTPTR